MQIQHKTVARARAPAHATGRSTARVAAAATLVAALCPLACLAQATEADDLTAQPLEQLMQTEVVSVTSAARSITDAASAISVLSRQDILAHGANTLAQVLDLMRGIHVSYDAHYGYLGARGIGGSQVLAGRVMLFIDGVPAVDNLYDQLYLVQDSVLDVALIERIEYAPGSGSALYGNNAFLGVINVVTRRGRDLDGLQMAVQADSWHERSVRASWGRRLADDAEVLVSTTLRDGGAAPAADFGYNCLYLLCDGRSQQVLLKGRWGSWRSQFMGAQNQTKQVSADSQERALDRNMLLNIGHESAPAEHWRTSSDLTLGRYAYRYRLAATDPYDLFHIVNDGGWWTLDGKALYTGWANQRLALALQVRRDPVLRFTSQQLDPGGGPPLQDRGDGRRQAFGASMEHEMNWSQQWHSTVGLRVDRRTGAPWTWSPRAALAWEPEAAWSVKLSHGRATRFASASERLGDQSRPLEHVTTSELVGEFHVDTLRLLSSLYRFRADPTISPMDIHEGWVGHGLEVEAQWDWHGWNLRASHAWQNTTALGMPQPTDTPNQVSKILLSVPLDGDRWRLALTLRHTEANPTDSDNSMSGQHTIDLTLLAQRLAPGLSGRLGVRNLTGAITPAQQEYLGSWYRRSRNRQFWVEATWSPR